MFGCVKELINKKQWGDRRMDQEDNHFTLSIITVTYNAEKELQKTIESILSQQNIKEINIEYIIQDGLSSDKTLSIAKEYKTRLENKGITVNIYSEKDYGIYDAMNRGIRKSQGKWVCLLNAGDSFCDKQSLQGLKRYLEESIADVLYADYKRINSYVTRNVRIPDLKELRKTMIFCHQAIFIRDYIYRDNLYNCQYNLVADYDLMFRLYIEGRKFEHIPIYLIDYDTDGLSAKNMVRTYREIYKVRKDNAVIESKFIENIKYSIGIIIRVILANMSQSLRWKIYRKLKALQNNKG